MAFSLTGSIASLLHFRQSRFGGADEKRHRLLNCEATRLPYWRRRLPSGSGVATVSNPRSTLGNGWPRVGWPPPLALAAAACTGSLTNGRRDSAGAPQPQQVSDPK